jgi:hypothetical protein
MRTVALVLLLASALAGCGTTKARAREHLDYAGKDVFTALSDGDFRIVAGYLPAAERTAFMARAYGIQQRLKILEWEPVSLDTDEESARARMQTRLSWYELPSTSVRTETVVLDWKREDGAWFIERILGGPLPVPDPGAAPGGAG